MQVNLVNFRILIIAFVVLLFRIQSANEPVSEKSLELISKWGGIDVEEKAIIGQLGDFVLTSQNEIVLTDFQAHQVLFFTKSGKIIRRVGGKGQGPLEFDWPFNIAQIGDTLLIREINNGSRIQFLTLKGEFIRSVISNPTFILYNDWIVSGKSKIFHPRSGYQTDSLITIYNINGQKVTSFGNLEAESFKVLDMNLTKKFAKERKIAPTLKNDLILCQTTDKSIIAAHTAQPLLKKFSENGTLLWSKKLLHHDLDKIRENFFKSNEDAPERTSYTVCCRLDYSQQQEY